MIDILASKYKASHLLFCLLICLLAFGGNAWYPIFNADDIIQTQSVSGDSMTFMGQGRWGYYLVFHFLQGENPSGPFGLFLGLSCIFASGLIASEAIGLNGRYTPLLFSMVSSVSIYYGHLLIFDSVWIAYPIGILLAASSAFLFVRNKRYVLCGILLATSPAFYQPAIQVYVAILIAHSIINIPVKGFAITFRQLLIGFFILVISLFSYIISTKLASYFSGIPLWDRSKVDIIAAIISFHRIIDLVFNHALPFRAGINDYYFPWAFRFIVSFAFISSSLSFLLVCLRSKANAVSIVFGFFLFFLLSVSPFLLAIASPLDQFGPRSLITFSIVHAFYICSAVHWLNTGDLGSSAGIQERACGILFMSGGAIVLISALQSSKLAYDNVMAWQQDRMTINRMISRIDDIIQDTPLASQPALKIAVRFDQPIDAGPRGQVLSARYSPWSQEWIFRLLDNRFVRADDSERAQLINRSLTKPHWPARGSIYIDGDIIMVVVN
ncbi:glucosyltransferase domain-containing protein [Brucella sp. NBRC 12950]|uniref:glucosyltransferase domain-containing protein n=1 Tax=Brucella sp. NBRC 12950 TaxID=2994518 RepID=UPI00255695FE|nr:glucosyltransferase domain-containing protein [Brucella sp. NBRC 12950]